MLSTDLSPQRALEALPKSKGRAVTVERLAELLGLAPSRISALDRYLSQFVRAGLAAKGGRGFWRRHATGVLIGTFRGTRSGSAFVAPDNAAERTEGDLFIGERSVGAAIHGDKVIARVIAVNERGRQGRIEAVLQQSNPTVVGSFASLKGNGIVSPLDDRLSLDVAIAASDTSGANDGDIVNVEITRRPIAGRGPWGRVIEVVGRPDDRGVDIEIVIRKHRLPHVFPDAVLKEAAAISETIRDADLEARADLRELLVITIDGETARDFDDAVSLEQLPKGRTRVGVHIADVSFYVREDSGLDEEAFNRGTSVYFPERAVPMLPERLSNDICSLNPRVDRLTMSVIMELDRRGRLLDYKLTPSVIRSRERMTYTAVNDIINDPAGETARRYSHLREMLLAMHALTNTLIQRREERGAIDFDLPEAELLFNDEGQICGIVRSERNIAHRLIEELMLLANETVATHLARLGVPLLYRVHEEPNPQKVGEFAEIAESFGHKFSMHGRVLQSGFQHLSQEIRGRPEERMLSYLMLRSMQRARYSPRNLGHFGLAMSTYCHFTSPIRRYPDLIVHRILREVIERGRRSQHDWESVDIGSKRALKLIAWPVLDEDRQTSLPGTLEMISDHSSRREREADDAERELMEWRKVELMSGRVGEEFDGVITSVKDYGFYVELNELFVEGLVHVLSLGDDRFAYRERKHDLVGVRSGRRYGLGDTVRIQVVRVDRTRHLIDFAVVGV